MRLKLILLNCHKSLISSDELAHISDHMGQLRKDNIFNRSRVNIGMNNLFVILEIKSFGEVRLIITIKAPVPFLTLSFPEVLLKSDQSSKFATTVLTLNLEILETSPARLVSNKIVLCGKRFVTWLVTKKGFAVLVKSFEVHR